MSTTTKRILLAVLSVAVVLLSFAAAYRITLRLTTPQTATPPAAPPAGESETAAPGQPAATEQTAAPDADQTTRSGEQQTANPAQTGETAPATEAPSAAEPSAPQAEDPVSPTYIGGILVVNKSYPLPRSYDPGGLTDECESAFYEMQAAAAEEGLDLYISSGFRSYELQSSLYQRYCDRDGQAAADTYSARPGHSEHQSGLAIDLNTITSDFAYTAEGKWVNEHCWEYGFILRYPADKVSVTGYMYEPWHIRYLGKETAKAVYDSGLCLEEYLGIDSVYR